MMGPSTEHSIAVCLRACVFTLFTVAVAPVHSARVAPEKAPGSDPAVRVAAVVVLSYPFARVALTEAGHLGPVHAADARLGDVYRPPVEAVSPAALDAVGKGQDEWRDAAGAGEAAIRSQERGCEGEQRRGHVRCVAVRQAAEDGRFCLLSSAEERVCSQPHRPAAVRDWAPVGEKKKRRGSMKLLFTWADGQAASRPKSHNVFVISPQIAILYHLNKSMW